jgi:hypothetical protein
LSLDEGPISGLIHGTLIFWVLCARNTSSAETQQKKANQMAEQRRELLAIELG